jgi:hypothetical protein
MSSEKAAAAADCGGLINVASLSNHELFTEVIAAISRCFKSRNKKDRPNNWMPVALKISVAAARGETGCCCPDDWVTQFNEALSSSKADSTSTINFSEALQSLDAKECYLKRLCNVIDHPSLPILSVRQAAGLVRGSSLLSKESKTDNNNVDEVQNIQARVFNLLVKAMPQLCSSDPCDIFLAVQLPVLQSLERNAFTMGGITFPTKDVEHEFYRLLDLDFCDTPDSIAQVGEKRKRTASEEQTITSCHNNYTQLLLEAAHLARNGAVRAQHGAIIFCPSSDGTIQEVLGRGWNHDYFLMDRAKTNKNKVVLHSECHAIADALKRYGEDECFNVLFPKAQIFIAELISDFAYDDSHPCPKCDPLLRAVGITKTLYTMPDGTIMELALGTPCYELLGNENCSLPLKAACDEQGITCKRLADAMKEAANNRSED